MDNRPLKFDEFEALVNQIIFVSATPADYELAAMRRDRRGTGDQADRPA